MMKKLNFKVSLPGEKFPATPFNPLCLPAPFNYHLAGLQMQYQRNKDCPVYLPLHNYGHIQI